MKAGQVTWTEFGWQGIRLRVPDDWNLGRMEGDHRSGYVRLDDAEVVRAELEWRPAKEPGREPVTALVDRYVDSLEKKARKAGMAFTARRRARFLKDRSWLADRECETFTWEADFRAYNLALNTGSGRIVLLRVLTRLDESPSGLVEAVCRSLDDHSQAADWFWSVYGLEFSMPADFRLETHELKSGHLQLSFEKDKQVCRVQRLSLAQVLLKGVELADWYPFFFKKQLRDMNVEVVAEPVRGHPGLRVAGRPRSRWRQLLRPLPWVNPRPRLYMDSRVWHCEATDKICVVDHLFRKQEAGGELTGRVVDGYICHQQEQAEAEPRGHAELAPRPQRSAELGEERDR
jgi:hypothetical protein